jgi:predicted glycoside hydrolase/deacetylase ChbG (UPF0249 family)
MLIVNADDWGLRPEITDAILECRRAGAVTCASAMVHMEDSVRAASLAAEEDLPLGLHLNLTTPFTAAEAPVERRSRQQRAVDYFAGPRLRRFVFDPRARGALDACVADQLEAFEEAFGRPVRHADGHQHIQVCPTVLSTGSLGRLKSLRGAHSLLAGRSSPAKRAYRGIVNAFVHLRFRTARFVSLRDLHPDLGGIGLESVLRDAAHEDVEVMVHPAWEDERRVLLSAGWRQALRGLPIGSHADLG